MDKYDVIIIGGGISGLYSAYKIQKLCPDKSIMILEKGSCLGGRMDTYNFYNTTVNIGAGIGRKEKDGILIKLLNELKIDYKEYSIDMKYSDTIHKNDIYSDIDVTKTIACYD
jgi:protoporphyrinogen oxidase